MSNGQLTKFALPESSWATLKKIIRAYHAKRGVELVTVQEVAQIAGLHRPQISANNNFLRTIGVLEQDSNKLTSTGAELALGISRDDLETVRQALRKVVETCAPLAKLVETVEARGELSDSAFRTQVHLVLNVDENERRARWIGTIIDLLAESGTISVDGDIVRPGSGTAPLPQPLPRTIAPVPIMRSPGGSMESTGLRRIPVPVSPGSLWYVEVSENPNREELEKFLEMQKLIFSLKKE